jgi:hypothetical protein
VKIRDSCKKIYTGLKKTKHAFWYEMQIYKNFLFMKQQQWNHYIINWLVSYHNEKINLQLFFLLLFSLYSKINARRFLSREKQKKSIESLGSAKFNLVQ